MKKLDKKDQRILYELYKDGRASLTTLSSRVGVSKESLGYRLKRLEKENVLTKITTVVDASVLGYKLYRFQVALTSEGKKKKDEFINKLIELPEVSSVSEVSGRWDFIIIFMSKSAYEFQAIYEKFLEDMGTFIDKKIISTVFSISHLPPTYLLGEERLEIKQEIKEAKFELDEKQDEIINLLEEDARMPLLQIAKKLNVSISTIKYHLKLLEKNKIILSYKPVLKLDELGYEHFNVLLDLADPSNKRRVKEMLKMNPHVVLINESLSSFDLEFECQYNNVKKLLNDLNKLEEEIHIKNFDIIFANKEIINRGIPDFKNTNINK